MAKLESLIVDIQANTAELRKGLDEANRKIKDFDDKIKDLAGVIEFKEIGEMALEAGKKLAEFALRGAEVADQMVKMSQISGLSVEQLSRLNFAASISRVSTEDLGIAMGKLNVAISKAGAGVSDQRALFNALGIAVKDASGNIRSTNDILGDVADRFSKMEGAAGKAQLATELFGKSGKQLIPLLDKGREGIAELSAEADRLGITLDSKSAEAAEHFNDNLEKLKRSSDALQVKVAGELAPAFGKLTDELLNSKNRGESLKQLVDVLTTALKLLATVAVGVASAFNIAGTTIGAAASIIADAVQGKWQQAKEGLAELGRSVSGDFAKLKERVETIWKTTTDTVTKEGEKQATATKKSSASVIASFEAQKKYLENLKEAMKGLTKMAEEYSAKVAGFDQGSVQQLAAKLESGELTNGIKITTEEMKKLRDRILDAATALEALERKKLAIEIDFRVQQSAQQTYRDVSNRARAFDNIGVTQDQQLRAFTEQSGFKNFSDALAEYSKQVDLQNRALGDVEQAKLRHDNDAAFAYQRVADNAKNAAEDASKAADAFNQLAEHQLRETEATINNINQGISAAGSQLAGKLGTLGSVIQAGVQGFQSGGIYGAIAAVAIELFSRFKRFGEILEKANNQVAGLISQLGPVFETMTDGFEQLQKALGNVSHIIGQLLAPVFSTVGKTFGYLAQVLAPIAGMVGIALQPLITILMTFQKIGEAVLPLQPAISILATIFNAVAYAILFVTQGMESAIATILEAIRSLLASIGLNDLAKAVSEIEISIAQAAQDAQAQLDKLNESLSANIADPFATSNNDVNNQTTETTDTTTTSIDNLGKTADKTAQSIAKISQELFNVPQGFKYNLRAYQAQQATGALGGSSIRQQLPQVVVQLSGVVGVTVEQLVGLVTEGINKQQFNNGGAPPTATGPYKPHF
jgi:hypothetical protein